MKKDLLAFCERVVEKLYKPKGSKGLHGKYTSFLIKFLLFSTALYLLWIPFASAYFSVILKIAVAYFELIEMDISAYLEIIGTDISLNPSQKFVEFAYSQGIRSCIPPFIALILATNFDKTFLKSFRESAILKGLIIGIPVLFFFRVILQISLVYFAYLHIYQTFVIFLSGTCRVALPFLLWLALSYKQIYPLLKPEEYTKGKSGLGDKKGYICPFCGAEKVGILDHIKTVHGEEALKSEKVEQLLKQNLEINRKK